MSTVIEAVLKRANKKANSLPSGTTVKTINVQRGILTNSQIAKELSKEKNTTLETMKAMETNMEPTLSEQVMEHRVLGLRDLLTSQKFGKDTLDTLKDTLG